MIEFENTIFKYFTFKVIGHLMKNQDHVLQQNIRLTTMMITTVGTSMEVNIRFIQIISEFYLDSTRYLV